MNPLALVRRSRSSIPSVLVCLALTLASAAPIQAAASADPASKAPATRGQATPKGEVAAEAQPEEINVAATSRGASATANGATDLLALLDESNGTAASLAPNQPSGTSVTTINLADATDVARIALEVGNQKGRLQIFAVSPDGGATAASDPTISGKLISEFVLDGSHPTLSANLGNLAVKTLALVWIPDTPGQPLTVSNVGVFTRNPPAAALAAAANTAAKTQAAAAKAQNTADSAAGAAPETGGSMAQSSTAQPSRSTATAEPPQTRAVSVP
jgi:hypothetical protein